MAHKSKICGIPITRELILRLALFLATLATLIAMARPKIITILGQVNVVSMSITTEKRIPVPEVLVCGQYLESAQVERLHRRPGMDDKAFPFDPNMFTTFNMNEYNFTKYGDWRKDGKCIHFNHKNLFFAENTMSDVEDPTTMDVLILTVSRNATAPTSSPFAITIHIAEGYRSIMDQEPIRTGFPSVNTITVAYSERTNKTTTTNHHTAQKQSLLSMPQGYAVATIMARILISPDTFNVTRFKDIPSYTWADLLAAVGGLVSLAVAAWIFLFGSGKYKSWGIMQRYVLRTSPDSRRSDDDLKDKPDGVFQRTKHFVRDYVSRLDSSSDHEADRVPLRASTYSTQERQRLSTLYGNALNMGTLQGTPAVGAEASGVKWEGRNSGERTTKGLRQRNDRPFSTYYFSDLGSPRSNALQPLGPMNTMEDEEDALVEELIRLIDLRIDERMWSLERTLARYYLEGFRLRHYPSIQQSEEQTPQRADNYLLPKTESTLGQDIAGIDGDGDQSRGLHPLPMSLPSESGPLPSLPGESLHSIVSLPDSAPAYPSRPAMAQNYTLVLQNENSIPEPRPGAGPVFTPGYDIQRIPARSSGLPGQSMRGSLRKAVERLQHEWPASQPPSQLGTTAPYVPRTHYTNPNNNHNQGHYQRVEVLDLGDSGSGIAMGNRSGAETRTEAETISGVEFTGTEQTSANRRLE